MLCARLDAIDTYRSLLTNPIWAEALLWLRTAPQERSRGIHQLRGDDMFANVHGYATRTRELSRYESHRRYVDLQYCVSGGEIVEWHPLKSLVPSDSFDLVKDVIHYQKPVESAASLRMSAGYFAVFFPDDGHMPKMADGQHPQVEKIVIKIDLGLLVAKV